MHCSVSGCDSICAMMMMGAGFRLATMATSVQSRNRSHSTACTSNFCASDLCVVWHVRANTHKCQVYIVCFYDHVRGLVGMF